MSSEVVVASGGLDCHLMSGCGFPAPDAGIFVFDPIVTFTLFGIDFNVSKITILIAISVLIVIGFFLYAFRKPQLVPKGAQNVGEMAYLFIRDGIAREIIGKGADRYVPFLFSFFFLIWIMNSMGILPFAQIPTTSMFAIPVAFALIVYVTWIPVGIYRQGFGGFFKNMMFPPGVPKAMYILLAPLEFFSNMLVRPFTHSVRLFANMFAGHLLIATFSVATFYLISASVVGILGSVASFAVTIGLTAFEALVQALQAYVFTLLTAVYLAGALHPEH